MERERDRRGRAAKRSGTPHWPVVVMGVLVGLTVVGGLTVVELSRWRRSSLTGDVAATRRSPQAPDRADELEALRLRVALLSARLAGAEGCQLPAAPAVAAPSGDAPPPPEDDVPAPAASASDPPNAPAVTETLPALSTPWATEVYLRELAGSVTPGLALGDVVCSDEVCRLSFGAGASPADDALKLQSFVGRAAERLPKALIRPGASGAASMVLVARPGHELPLELPDLPKQTAASQPD